VRLIVALLFIATVFIFLNAGWTYLSQRLGRPLVKHRLEHEAIEARLEDLETRDQSDSQRREGP
jgi:cytidylate kinase